MDPDEFIIRLIFTASITTLIIIIAVGDATTQYASRFEKRAQHTSRLTGELWVQELLCGHDDRIYNELGMHKPVFQHLLEILKRDAGILSTRYVSAEEQLATFLHYAHRGLSNRALQERFQRSADTISKYVS